MYEGDDEEEGVWLVGSCYDATRFRIGNCRNSVNIDMIDGQTISSLGSLVFVVGLKSMFPAAKPVACASKMKSCSVNRKNSYSSISPV